MQKNEITTMVVRIEKKLHQQFKKLCIDENTTIQEYVARLLKEEIEKLGKECLHFDTFDEIENYLLQNSINGDLLITMGAGDIVKVGENLLGL